MSTAGTESRVGCFQQDFGPRELRDLLGHFATGVAVVSCVAGDGVRLGSTVSSFNSVSLDPPLTLFSLANSALSIDQWKAATSYGVSILHADQVEISNRFARATTQKWAGVATLEGPVMGVPLIANSLAWMECEPYANYDGGDHTIFVGRIVAIRKRMHADGAPLVFFKGRYQQLAKHSDGAPPAQDPWLHGW